ncbi:hypothetical protein CASFOL_013666 [Castilleja foliolosa]|uniref:SBP-type domain-containing protein n=1 Tax=Castilleja foliolosa TaxID=1961234 RepID=A0ABD3DPP4_9LAMI
MERSNSEYHVVSACQDPTMIGLRLGRQNDAIPSGPAKRSRASYQNMQNPCCQVEGCNLDLKSAKDYHRRHRICEGHSKSPKVMVAGMERRFCQQCSRFHDLSEFDDKKRSCRRRLSDHNARRRRVQPESVHPGPIGLSSALYDQRQRNVLLNGLPVVHSNPTWDDANSYMFRQALVRPSDEIRKSIFELQMDLDKLSPMQSSNPRFFDQGLHVPTTNAPMGSDMLSAHSLLSSNSWSLNEGESTPMYGNYVNPVMRKSNLETENVSVFQSFNVDPMEQGVSVTMVHNVNEGTSYQQEYQLFKADCNSNGFCFGQRNL